MRVIKSWSEPSKILWEPQPFRDEINVQLDETSPIIVWFRGHDLRVLDHPALYEASKSGRAVIPLFVRATKSRWRTIGAAAYYQLQSLLCLNDRLVKMYGSKLIFRMVDGDETDAAREVVRIAEQFRAVVYTNRVYEPWRVSALIAFKKVKSVSLRVFKGGSLLYEPDEARPQDEQTRLGFGSVGWFLRSTKKLGDPQKPLPAPKTLVSPSEWPWSFDATKHLGMVSNDPRVPDWWKDIRTSWTFGEFGAHAALRRFLNSDALENFEDRARLIANESNTSSLSPHLRFGELSPRYVYHSILQARERQGYENTIAASATFLRRLAWRDLSYWSVVEFPFICDWSIRPQYESEKWSYDAETFERWSRGQTGYPLVDAVRFFFVPNSRSLKLFIMYTYVTLSKYRV